MTNIFRDLKKNFRDFDPDKYEYYQQLAAGYELIEECWAEHVAIQNFLCKNDFYDMVNDAYQAAKGGLTTYNMHVSETPLYAYSNLDEHIRNNLMVKFLSESIRWRANITLVRIIEIENVIVNLIFNLLYHFKKIDCYRIVCKKGEN